MLVGGLKFESNSEKKDLSSFFATTIKVEKSESPENSDKIKSEKCSCKHPMSYEYVNQVSDNTSIGVDQHSDNVCEFPEKK